jgi:hypothetical protein
MTDETKDQCQTCRFYITSLDGQPGTCHAGHPTVIGVLAPQRADVIDKVTLFPQVKPDWWCGEHQAKA